MDSAAQLHARPSRVTQAAPVGRQTLDVAGRRETFLYIPQQYDPARQAPLVLLLHGAGGHAHHGPQMLSHLAEDNGLILLAPASAARTWDVIHARRYGADAALIDQALEAVFSRYAVDAEHLAIGGFSDGASYALSLGLANGDLFSHVIAFSPGFIASAPAAGKPGIFIAHGTRDDVLPINPCSRLIVQRLRKADYAVTYDEFDGGHTIPADMAAHSVQWLLGQA